MKQQNAGKESIVSMACQAEPNKYFVFRIINNNTRKRSKTCSK